MNIRLHNIQSAHFILIEGEHAVLELFCSVIIGRTYLIPVFYVLT